MCLMVKKCVLGSLLLREGGVPEPLGEGEVVGLCNSPEPSIEDASSPTEAGKSREARCRKAKGGNLGGIY
jgi:hypothetical protein